MEIDTDLGGSDYEPNGVTLEAMREAESEAMRDVQPLDMSSIEAMEKSMEL